MPLPDLIVFIDAHRPLQWLVGMGLLLIVGYLAVPSGPSRSRRQPWLFFLFVTLALFFWRGPILSYPENLCPDEAQMLAQAITYRTHPVPWRDIDGITSGPINSYALLWCVPLGLQPNYPTTRAAGLFCILGMMLFLYLAGRRLAGDSSARLVLLPILLFVCFTTNTEFIHYSSERISLLLLGASIWLLTRLRRAPGALPLIASLGFILGLLPFAKLQSTIPGAFLGLVTIWFLATRTRTRRDLQSAALRILLLIVASILPCLMILSTVAWAGALDDFWKSYIQMGQDYSAHFQSLSENLYEKLFLIRHILNPNGEMAWFIYLMGISFCLIVFHIMRRQLKLTRSTREWYVISVLFALVIFETILFPGYPYTHYQFYFLPGLVFPMLVGLRILRTNLRRRVAPAAPGLTARAALPVGYLIAVIVFFDFWAHADASEVVFPFVSFAILTLPLAGLAIILYLGARTIAASRPVRERSAVLACLIPFFLLPAIALSFQPNPYRGQIGAFLARPPLPMDEAILRVRPPGGRLAIWGWAPEYAAETGTTLGTRDSVGQYVINAGPLQTYYRQRFLRDMQANRPELFLEATGPHNYCFQNSTLYGFETFPELAKFVSEQYLLKQEIDGMRLFVRRDLDR